MSARETAVECLGCTRLEYRYMQICLNLLLLSHGHLIFVSESHRPNTQAFYLSRCTLDLADFSPDVHAIHYAGYEEGCVYDY